ncbi:MAG: hypothetical protein K6D54_05530 [Bacteroidales bacterium]|nr:hypothetical protein [Bacteroidales bacterium]
MDTKLTQLYESPAVRIVEIAAEGVVCQSGDSMENWPFLTSMMPHCPSASFAAIR